MTSVHDVAAYILAREGNLSTMKLQKLCYYAQGWHLAWHGERLFDEPIKAWRMGPVCPALYRYHRGQASVSDWPQGSKELISPSGASTIDIVADFYQPFTGFDLGNRTHSERPWLEAWESAPPQHRGNAEISTETLREYFRSLHEGSEHTD
ncbi:putative phage-associated protein [Arthrobacter sp. GAS37]|uniref:Panacea domain-containing protein n=1 Tax=Arthrobacter sp. GAS37 TaxID=3156261 RepID=UPI0038369746